MSTGLSHPATLLLSDQDMCILVASALKREILCYGADPGVTDIELVNDQWHITFEEQTSEP